MRHNTIGGAIVARNLQTGDERDVYPFAGGAAGLALSPDGRHLAINANLRGADSKTSPYPSIVILPVSGGDSRTLFTSDTADSSSWRQMTWSPDGAPVLFAKHHQEVWQVPAAGGPASRVLADLEFINSISVHPDGRRLAVSAGNAKYETWVMERLLPPSAQPAKR